MRLAALPACSSSRGHAAATQRGAAAAAWPQRARTSKQQRLGRVRVLSNTEQLQDSWSPQARAAVLGLKLEAWDALLPVAPLLASCDPSGLFVLKEVAGLLELSVADAVALAAQVPALLRTPSLQVEAHIAVLQRQLFLGRPDAVQLLRSDAALVALSTRALEGAAVRLAKGCGISSPGGFATLGWLCSRCEGMALSDVGGTQQRVDALARAMGVSAATALDVLRVEAALFGDADELLEAPGNVAAAWAGLAKQLGLPAKELAAEVVQQLLGSEPRYSLRATQQLQADVAALAEMSSLPAPVLLRMLLAAPGLNAVPRSFWRVLFQYVLLLMPHWRDELDELDQRQAGRLVVELCAGSASSDVISVEPADDAFATADVDYNRQVMVLNALLDQGVMAPVFETRDSIRAGKLWRLVYLCNPRHQAAAAVAAARRAAYNKAKRQQAGSKPGSNGKTGGLWTWAALLPLPAPLLQQLQDSGALACDLPAAANSSSGSGSGGAAPGTAAGAAPAGEEVEDLLEVVRLSTSAFCARHPGYAHWLSVTAFELEWSNSRAAAPVSTWDAGSYARSAGGGASW